MEYIIQANSTKLSHLNEWFRCFPLGARPRSPATRLVTDALQMALQERESDGVIHHSDQGTQYTSIEFGLRLQESRHQTLHGLGR